jgi:hypothetical protein
MRLSCLLLWCAALVFSGCHPGPIIDAGAKQPTVGGTIAGLVTTSDRLVPVPGRVVTAIDTKTGARFDVTTADNGGYTVKVPEGTYRIQIELRAGETLVKQPGETRVRNSDLDAQRDFMITVKAAPLRQ